MYNQTYEDYMRNVLGYIPTNKDMEYTYRNDYQMNNMHSYRSTVDVEAMYPDIYKIIYPMVKKACASSMGEINEKNIEQITMEVFTNVEVNMNVENQSNMQNRKTDTKLNTKVEVNRNTQENRNNNSLLRDLIRILVLREIIDGNRPNHPPFPGPRPPFPGGPAQRPPFQRGMGQVPTMMYSEEYFY